LIPTPADIHRPTGFSTTQPQRPSRHLGDPQTALCPR
jgi:hypothetical protein